MKTPKTAHKLVAPFLALLGRKIRERGFTALEVGEALGWGRSHIKQLMAGRKGLRVDQMHSILDVIGLKPKAFFAELYGMPPAAAGLRTELARVSILVDSLADLMVANELVTASELRKAVAARAGKRSAA